MKISLVQINTRAADFKGNLQLIKNSAEKAASAGSDFALFPLGAISGMPCEDNNFSAGREYSESLKEIAGMKLKTVLVFPRGGHDMDGAMVVRGGRLELVSGRLDEDIIYRKAPCCGKHNENLVHDAAVALTAYAVPYVCGSAEVTSSIAREAAKRKQFIFASNMLGANDSFLYEGRSCVFSPDGKMIAEAASFREDLLTLDTESYEARKIERPEYAADMTQALVMGIGDYFRKLGFKKAVIGLSGGIDSAVVSSLAVRALGAENVTGVLMPSEYTSSQSNDDAHKLAGNLGIKTLTVEIKPLYDAFVKQLGLPAETDKVSVTRQNLQARARACVLMALSNENGWLVLNTGNKSEEAAGYCTLYGDSIGALAPISDVLKTEVYMVAKEINRAGDFIPESILTRAPTAELRPGQKDQDELPPYDVLDRVVKHYTENSCRGVIYDIGEISGLTKKQTEDIIRKIKMNEYKRRQVPMCFKVSPKAFFELDIPVMKKI